MGLQDISFLDTYWSGENDLINEFYIPCLSESVEYCRAVGYFSSSILCYITNGLFPFIQNGGKIRILCSTNLSKEDEKALSLGYDIRRILQNKIESELTVALNLNLANIKNLCWLVKNERLDIRICLRVKSGLSKRFSLFHEKFGIFKDLSGNSVSFLGSINETYGGWVDNEESFEVSQSWIPSLAKRVESKEQRFENLWNGTAKDVITYNFPEACRRQLIEHAPDVPVDGVYHGASLREKTGFQARKCQEAAKDFFMTSGFRCLFMMATGTGKTKAALYALSQLDSWQVLLICVPGIELVEQWDADVRVFFPELTVIRCSSLHSDWKRLLLALIQAKIPKKAVIITTYNSAVSDFSMDKWKSIKPEKLAMICDEVHNIGAKSTRRIMELDPQYRIGLSATPERHFDEEGSALVLNYFNHQTYEFSIKDAQREHYLVEYEYRVLPVLMDDDDWQNYLQFTEQITKYKYSLRAEHLDASRRTSLSSRIEALYRDRADLIKKAEVKIDSFDVIFAELPPESRILIYGDDLQQLHQFEDKLQSLRQPFFEYTGDKDPQTVRPIMLQQFRQGIRKILLAIGCLDEGVDIPTCDAAVFVSSSTSERQFIQRRGRVLRTAPGKHRAWIYDYLLVPQLDSTASDKERQIALTMIESQHCRINLMVEDALNGLNERTNLDQYLSGRGLNPYEY
ncbi:MAG: DEAD/DEAH box helicase family protein [Oscillibacter sp.]|nr:DEAD/DEAH box helicase family protein [Oscillibacter sp.]